jgi:hypothetical protein
VGAVQSVGGFVTNTGATPLAFPQTASPSPGDTFAIQNFALESEAYLVGLWAKSSGPLTVRIRSPKLHDVAEALRVRIPANTVLDMLGLQLRARVYPQDNLIVEVGDVPANSTVALNLQLYYRDLPGIQARLATWGEVAGRIEYLLGQVVTTAAPGTPGTWGPGDRIVKNYDNLRVNRDYAILGYILDATIVGVAVRGTDTGNLRVGGPGHTDLRETREFYKDSSERLGTPFIPVFNSANRLSFLVDVLDTVANTAVNVTFILALLR